jgi:hypothetical protein
VAALLYTRPGNTNQKLIIIENQRKEEIKKANGVTFFKKNKVAEHSAKTFTSITMIRISGLVIK